MLKNWQLQNSATKKAKTMICFVGPAMTSTKLGPSAQEQLNTVDSWPNQLQCPTDSSNMFQRSKTIQGAGVCVSTPDTKLVSRPPTNLAATLHPYLSCWLIFSSQRVPNSNCLLPTPLVPAISVRFARRSISIYLAREAGHRLMESATFTR